jgi:hypothetical protein
MPASSSKTFYLERLSGALVGAVEDGRIGLPRFVRWLDRVPESISSVDSITDAREICNRVFGSQPVREHRSGDGVKHQTVHAVWANGSSALISFGPAGAGVTTEPEIMLLGSSGAMYFDGALGGSPTVDQVVRS